MTPTRDAREFAEFCILNKNTRTENIVNLAQSYLDLEQKLRAAEYLLKEAKTFIDEKFEYFDEENDRGALDILHLFDRFESGEFDALRDGGNDEPRESTLNRNDGSPQT